MPRLRRKSDRERREDTQKRMSSLRTDGTVRRSQRIKDASARRLKRQDEEGTSFEQDKDTKAHKRRRKIPAVKEAEQNKDTQAHKQRRKIPAVKEAEQNKDTQAHKQRRKIPAVKEAEQNKDTQAHKQRRKIPAVKEPEQNKDTQAHKQRRKIPAVKEAEQNKDTQAHKQRRKNPAVRKAEQDKNTQAHQRRRENETYRTPEKVRNANAHKRVRENPVKRRLLQATETESKRKRRKLDRNNFNHLLEEYKKMICEAPEYTCSCCGGLWYKKSTSVVTTDILVNKGCSDTFISAVLPVVQNEHRLCQTCKNCIFKKQIPKLCLTNGFQFPAIPSELEDLSPLEERLVAARLPFMQIRPTGSERQCFLRGNVVNVENDLDICAEVLPRRFDDISTIQVQLMRKMSYRKPYIYETIRPAKVYKAAQYLADTDLYKEEGIILSEGWTGYAEEVFANAEEEETQYDVLAPNLEQTGDSSDFLLGQLYDSNTMELGAEETLMFLENDFTFYGVRIAPGEGKRPLPLLRDLNAEVLSFPSIYCGQPRDLKIRATYTDIAKSELRRFDRRASKPTKLLYSFKRSFNEKVCQAVQVCLRKKMGTSHVTAAEARTPQFIENLLSHDEGYAVFKNIRSSPSYWKRKTQIVTAMVRQVGKCGFFITLSAAETKWYELLVMLSKIVQNKNITEEQAAELTFEEKAELIRSDPVTCMRHFDHRYRALLNLILKPEGGIFSPYKLVDYFSRMEFQMRGSPHSHGLYWIEDSPVFKEGDEESEQKCVEFVDKFITCERCEDGGMENLIGYQIHKHSHTCAKKLRKGQKCRFGFPKPPMKMTCILSPLSKDMDPEDKKTATELYQRIQDKLNLMGRSFKEDIEFTAFLESMDTNEQDYIIAIRSSIKRTTTFLKRSTNAIFVNGYNRTLLETWKANIDVQFVLDTYACAKYCVGYILKAQGGVSKLLRAAVQEVRKGNLSIRERLQKYGNVLINGSEISAQEAAAFLLQIPNTMCSRQDVFINTAPPDERIGILKSSKELEELQDDSDDVFCKGLIDHYVQRPEELEHICLAEFASLYEFSKKAPSATRDIIDDDISLDTQEEDEILSENEEANKDHSIDIEEVENDTNSQLILSPRPFSSNTIISANLFLLGPPKQMQLLDKSGYIRKRRVQKIIRFRHYGKYDDPQNYWREQLMLFISWRDEQDELLSIDAIRKADDLKQEIIVNSKPFYYSREIDDNVLSAALDELEEELNDDDQETTEEINEMQNEKNDDFVNEFEGQNYTSDCRAEQFLPPKMIPDTEYLKIMRRLNDKQRRFVLHNLHLFKISATPFYSFLSGGAGVGKSEAIMAIVQSCMRYYATLANENPDSACVIVGAPTGKAAFNVFGMTLHGIFKLPPTQHKGTIGNMEDGPANTLRTRLSNTKLFIIDEISMVNVNQFYDINSRLKQIFRSNEDFGNRSILVVGHLRQLPPIPPIYVFELPKIQQEKEEINEILGNTLWKKFSLFEFDEIMRQKGEYEFCKALNNMSEGVMDSEDIALIRSREISSTNEPPMDATWLFSTNKDCQLFNDKIHKALNTEGVVSIAKDFVQGSGTDAEKRNLLRIAKTLTPQQSDGLPYKTRLQLGGEYFVTTNVNVQDGLFNGATGNLKMIEYFPSKENLQPTENEANSENDPKNDRVPKRGWMDFRNPLIGIEKRVTTRNYQIKNYINLDWVAIDRFKRDINKTHRYHSSLQLFRDQIPLVAANAMTIHKAQGSSMPNVVVSMKGQKLTRAKLYVACSRATSRNGLFIDGTFQPPNPPKPDDKVTLEMRKLREAPLQLSLQFLQDFDESFQKIYFHNVQSFIAHYADVQADNCPMSADFIALVEPHLFKSDHIALPGFNCVFRKDCRSETIRNSEGVLLFQNAAVPVGDLQLLTNPTLETDITTSGHCLFLRWQTSGVEVVVMYKQPSYPKMRFLFKLDQILQKVTGPSIFLGDANIDLHKPEGDQLVKTFGKKGLTSKLNLTKASTNLGTHIDCCFSNVPEVKAWFYESYYSYHKPICVIFPKLNY